MPAEFYLETIKIVFQDFNLPLGTWEIEGKPVRPQDIKNVALFTIEGELDDISGSGQTEAAQDALQRHPKNEKATFHRRKMRPLRDFLGPPLARNHLPEDRRLHQGQRLTA